MNFSCYFRASHNGVSVTFLGTLLGVRDFKKVKFPRRDNSFLEVKGLNKKMKSLKKVKSLKYRTLKGYYNNDGPLSPPEILLHLLICWLTLQRITEISPDTCVTLHTIFHCLDAETSPQHGHQHLFPSITVPRNIFVPSPSFVQRCFDMSILNRKK